MSFRNHPFGILSSFTIEVSEWSKPLLLKSCGFPFPFKFPFDSFFVMGAGAGVDVVVVEGIGAVAALGFEFEFDTRSFSFERTGRRPITSTLHIMHCFDDDASQKIFPQKRCPQGFKTIQSSLLSLQTEQASPWCSSLWEEEKFRFFFATSSFRHSFSSSKASNCSKGIEIVSSFFLLDALEGARSGDGDNLSSSSISRSKSMSFGFRSLLLPLLFGFGGAPSVQMTFPEGSFSSFRAK